MTFEARVLALTLLLALGAGCVDSDGSGVAKEGQVDGGTPSQTNSTAGSGCQEAAMPVLTKTWDTASSVTDAIGNEQFTLESDVDKIRTVGHSGPFVEARWHFQILNSSDNVVWEFEVTAPVTAVGNDNNVPNDTVNLGPGTYTASWEVEGGISSLDWTIYTIQC